MKTYVSILLVATGSLLLAGCSTTPSLPTPTLAPRQESPAPTPVDGLTNGIDDSAAWVLCEQELQARYPQSERFPEPFPGADTGSPIVVSTTADGAPAVRVNNFPSDESGDKQVYWCVVTGSKSSVVIASTGVG